MEDFDKNTTEGYAAAEPAPQPSEQAAAAYAAGMPARKRFTVTGFEVIAALLSFIAAYVYAKVLVNDWGPDGPGWRIMIVAGLLLVITELVNRGKKIRWESFVWLGVFLLCAVSCSFGIGEVWEPYQVFFFTHVFLIWWVLSRSDMLLDHDSSRFLPVDALDGFCIFPFRYFVLRIRTIIAGIRGNGERKAKRKAGEVWLVVLAVIAAVVLFIMAFVLLLRADSGFGRGIREFLEQLDLEWFLERFMWLILSLPVGAYLYGLIGGTARTPRAVPDGRRNWALRVLDGIRRVPGTFWTVVICLFSVLYIAFFAVQGSYLFGAFAGRLPEGFSASQYAREGFFELCKVMAVNFAVLWLTTRMTKEEDARKPLFTAGVLALLTESMIFAAIAFSKLGLYISRFGFTPLRLQSTWLVCVLFMGCLLWTVSFLSGKKTMRIWMIFGAVTLIALQYVPM